jgi:hypothetical protein
LERVVHIAKNHADAQKWDIRQQIEMSVEQRQAIARELRERFFGTATVDVRKSRAFRKRTRLEDEK